MKKRGVLVWLLLAAILLSGCSSGEGSEVTTQGSVTEAPPAESGTEILLASNGKANFEIIIPESCSGQVEDAANALKAKLKSVTGAVFMVIDDYTMGGKVTSGSNEILIGDCRRTAAKSALEGLRYRDYFVIADESPNIVIAGYESAAVAEGVNALIGLLDESNIVRTENEVRLKWTGSVEKRYEKYAFESISVGEVPLSSYRIVYPANVHEEEYLQAAFDVQAAIGKRCGYVLEIVTDAQAAQEYEILIGKTNREESLAYYAGEDAVIELEYGFAVCGKKLQLACGGGFSVPHAAEMFDSKVLGAMTAPAGQLQGAATLKASLVNDASIPACKGSYRFMSYNVLVEYEGWGSGGLIPSSVEIRKEAVAGLILRYLPDVVGLQELSEQWSKALPPAVSEIYGLVEPLRRDGTANAVPLLYNKQRLRLVESAGEDLGDKVGHITWGLFEDLQTGVRFLYFSTHWDARDAELRMEEARINGELIVSLQERFGVPVIATGDFNSGKSSEQVARFQSVSGLELLSPSTGVDHVFGSGFETVAGGIERENYAQFASDHKPVWVDCVLK